MGYPSYVKLIGMTESKKLLLRKTLSLNAEYGMNGKPDETGKTPNNCVFQVVLNPLECPNISKAFTNVSFPAESGNSDGEHYNRVFKYDYLRIKNIFISIKPAQNVSMNSGAKDSGMYTSYGDSPISNVYAYFTYRYPMLGVNDGDDEIKQMYGTNPIYGRIVEEGRMKNTYSWPSNKAMTISLSKLMYRVNTEPYRLFPNAPLDIQFLSKVTPGQEGVYDPFSFSEMDPIFKPDDDQDGTDETNENSEKQGKKGSIYDSTEETPMRGAVDMEVGSYGTVSLPDLKTADMNLFFGRLVIVSPKQVRFTVEICYDCVLLR